MQMMLHSPGKQNVRQRVNENVSHRIEPSDNELILSALSGDELGFAGLAERYEHRLYHSILALVRCPNMAEEIVQEAFSKAFLRLSSFRGASGFYTWVYRIALNSRPKARALSNLMSLDSDTDMLQYAGTNLRESPAMVAERKEDRKRVRDALSRLKSNHRRVLVLYEFDGLDYQTIAERLKISTGTVRSRLSRARLELRRELESDVGENSLSAACYVSGQPTRPTHPR